MRLRNSFYLLPLAVLVLAWLLTPAPTRTVYSAPVDPLDELIATMEPLALPLPEPGPSDWLAHYEEPGQSYTAWKVMDPVVATPDRRTLVIQPIGDFDPDRQRVMELATEWLGLFFGLPVRMEPQLPASSIPDSIRRKNPWTGAPQVHSVSLLYGLLRPRVSDDALSLLGITTEDLYPQDSWNFVFGQAAYRERIGVWSLHRFGDPSEGELAFRSALLRTMKLATHETGHNFTMHHCTAHACILNGSNNLPETDRTPAWLCPQCLAKLINATGADPVERFETLRAFCAEHGLETEKTYYSEALRLLHDAEPEGPRPLGPEL